MDSNADIIIWLSEILIGDSELTSFEDLKTLLHDCAAQGEYLFGMDVKSLFSDTPPDWDDQLKSIFTAKL